MESDRHTMSNYDAFEGDTIEFNKIINITDDDILDGMRTPVVTKMHDPLTTQFKMSFQIICEEEPEGYDFTSDVRFNGSNDHSQSLLRIQSVHDASDH